MHGDPRSQPTFAELPVVIVAYNGGFAPPWAIRNGDLGRRLRGVVLLDAAYGDMNVFADWAARQPTGFLSAPTRSRPRGETWS